MYGAASISFILHVSLDRALSGLCYHQMPWFTLVCAGYPGGSNAGVQLCAQLIRRLDLEPHEGPGISRPGIQLPSPDSSLPQHVPPAQRQRPAALPAAGPVVPQTGRLHHPGGYRPRRLYLHLPVAAPSSEYVIRHMLRL